MRLRSLSRSAVSACRQTAQRVWDSRQHALTCKGFCRRVVVYHAVDSHPLQKPTMAMVALVHESREMLGETVKVR
jgi:hypothetical protein